MLREITHRVLESNLPPILHHPFIPNKRHGTDRRWASEDRRLSPPYALSTSSSMTGVGAVPFVPLDKGDSKGSKSITRVRLTAGPPLLTSDFFLLALSDVPKCP